MIWIVGLLFVSIVNASLYEKTIDEANKWVLDYVLGNGKKDSSPCTNFPEYACGKYAERHIGEPFSGIFQEISHKVNHYLLDEVKRLEMNSTMSAFDDQSIDARLLRFYKGCLEAPPETRKIEHFLRLAPPGEGLTWPLLTTNGPELKWMSTVAYLFNQYGFTNVLFDVKITTNYENSTEHLLSLSNPDIVGPYFDYLEAHRILRELKIPPLRFLVLLNKVTYLYREVEYLTTVHNKGNRQVITVEQMTSRTGYDWHEFIQTIVGHDIQPNFRLQVYNLGYFTALKSLMDSTDTELLGSYIMINFALSLQYEIKAGGDPIDCIKYVRQNMYVASSLLITERFHPNLLMFLPKIEKIFEGVRQQLLLKIERNRLRLTAGQKDMALRKVMATMLNISNMLNRTELREFFNKYYEGLEIPMNDQDFAREHLNLLHFTAGKILKQLNELSADPKKYFILPEPDTFSSSGPYYLSPENVIVLPVDLLQEPFFLLNSHDVFTYSSLGFVLARELMHAIDKDNILYDSEGNVNEFGIEIAESRRFKKGLKCLGKTRFSNDRLADIGGLHLAYSAYLESVKSTRSENSDRKQVAKNFTSLPLRQVFFLNVAQSFCTSDFTKIGRHVVEKWRLEQMLFGSSPFGRTFECPPKDLQCQLW
ncbi:membrane metallo-endopeptidase-like 1 [Drosophila elegans]|uniref:membrane metallo-endopeptidase-like 1 n=1 Tax=Drosophila elegans TaxID=30023 RepID=UPI0007E6D72C|nr:membrane metallo-endopeptidase-like 1 [Drosophila elegans]